MKLTTGACVGAALSMVSAIADATDARKDAQPITSMEAVYRLGRPSANKFGMGADFAKRNGRCDESIRLAQEALKRQDNDLDLHEQYAEALEHKLESMQEEDPVLFNQCVKEWLIVLRNEAGDERGLSFHGISIMGHLYADEDHSIEARAHLVGLTGRAPKPWETDAKYLERVLRRETVKGKIVKDN
jgi:hypothetical protein